MRITISKAQHRALLEGLAKQLGGEPKDALEHILNCWQIGQTPVQPSSQPETTPAADELDNLVDWS